MDSNCLKIKDVLEEILIGWKILSVIFVIYQRCHRDPEAVMVDYLSLLRERHLLMLWRGRSSLTFVLIFKRS